MPDTFLPNSPPGVIGLDEFPDLDPVAEYVLRFPDLKSTIMECYFAGYLTQVEAEDLIHEYGLAGA